jgi:hypothetical protein
MIFGIVSPALGINVVFSSPNTQVTLGEAYSSLEFNNPLAGTETVLGHPVKEWRDAGWNCPTSEDWTVTGACTTCPEPCCPIVCAYGYSNEIWLRSAAHSATTTTTVTSTIVSVHLFGDSNDGMVDVLVDGILVATLDMWTSASDTAVVLVTGLPATTHTIDVVDQGVSQQAGGSNDDVALMGAAALRPLIDHFTVYNAAGPPGPFVAVDDQFFRQKRQLGPTTLFMVPADKNLEGLTDPFGHLTCYDMPGAAEGHPNVTVTNQLVTNEPIVVGFPTELCVPTEKLLTPGPVAIDHYKCYEASGPPLDTNVTLADQFVGFPSMVIEPFRLCNPAEKNGEPFDNADDHLVCYLLGPPGGVMGLPVPIANQFFPESVQIDISGPFALCVPSVKTLPEPSIVAGLGSGLLLLAMLVRRRRRRAEVLG